MQGKRHRGDADRTIQRGLPLLSKHGTEIGFCIGTGKLPSIEFAEGRVPNLSAVESLAEVGGQVSDKLSLLRETIRPQTKFAAGSSDPAPSLKKATH